jgi:hypothetical protein
MDSLVGMTTFRSMAENVSPNRGRKIMKELAWFTCGEQGHIAGQCPSRPMMCPQVDGIA